MDLIDRFECLTDDELCQFIRDRDYEFFELGVPTLEDDVYNIARQVYENNNTYAYTEIEPINHRDNIGELPIFVGSMHRFYETEGVQNWIEKKPEGIFGIFPKIDGLSFSAVYHHGILVGAFTRGNYSRGSHISHILPSLTGILPIIDTYDDWVWVRGELHVPVSQHKNFLEKAPRDDVDISSFEKPTAMALHLLYNHHPSVRKCTLNACIFEVRLSAMMVEAVSQTSAYAELMNIESINPLTLIDPIKETCHKKLEELSKAYKDRIFNNHYIDGFVIRDINRRRTKEIARKSEYQVAYKMVSKLFKSKIDHFDADVNGDGLLTFVAHLTTPVEFQGSVCNKVNVASYRTMIEGGYYEGAEVSIRLTGDTVFTINGNSDINFDLIPSFSKCPACGSPTIMLVNNLFCSQLGKCQGSKNKRIANAFSRRHLNIHGLSLSVIKRLSLASVQEILEVTETDLTSVTGSAVIGKKIFEQIREKAEYIRTMSI